MGFANAMPTNAVFDYSYNRSNFPDEHIWNHLPSWEIDVKLVTFIPVIILGIVGNFIIIFLIIKNRALRTPTNLLVANMALADMLTLLICPAMFMIGNFYQNYQLGLIGCKLEGFLEGSLLVAAVLNLSAVSYERLTAIVLPLEARVTIRAAKIVMICTWIAGISMAAPLAIYRSYEVREWTNFCETNCKESSHILPKYWYVLMVVIVWFPLSVILVSYISIFYKLDRYEKKVLRREHPLTVSYKKTVFKTLFILVIVFIALRVPFTVFVILRNNHMGTKTKVNDNFRVLSYSANYLMFLNAAVNPFIYGFNNGNFRRAFDQTPLCCSKKNISFGDCEIFQNSKFENWRKACCLSAKRRNLIKIIAESQRGTKSTMEASCRSIRKENVGEETTPTFHYKIDEADSAFEFRKIDYATNAKETISAEGFI